MMLLTALYFLIAASMQSITPDLLASMNQEQQIQLFQSMQRALQEVEARETAVQKREEDFRQAETRTTQLAQEVEEKAKEVEELTKEKETASRALELAEKDKADYQEMERNSKALCEKLQKEKEELEKRDKMMLEISNLRANSPKQAMRDAFRAAREALKRIGEITGKENFFQRYDEFATLYKINALNISDYVIKKIDIQMGGAGTGLAGSACTILGGLASLATKNPRYLNAGRCVDLACSTTSFVLGEIANDMDSKEREQWKQFDKLLNDKIAVKERTELFDLIRKTLPQINSRLGQIEAAIISQMAPADRTDWEKALRWIGTALGGGALGFQAYYLYQTFQKLNTSNALHGMNSTSQQFILDYSRDNPTAKSIITAGDRGALDKVRDKLRTFKQNPWVKPYFERREAAGFSEIEFGMSILNVAAQSTAIKNLKEARENAQEERKKYEETGDKLKNEIPLLKKAVEEVQTGLDWLRDDARLQDLEETFQNSYPGELMINI